MTRKEKEMKVLAEEAELCRRCSLCKSRTQPVIGAGSVCAKIMFIGEAPGRNEDLQGVPFCGRSGKILDGLLASVGLRRQDIYIANVIKCRPPQNRDPEEREIAKCSSYLSRQIDIVNPRVICPLGRYSMKFVMHQFKLDSNIDAIGKIHGKVFLSGKKTVVPFYHPAVVAYNPNMKKILEEDFKVLKKYVG